MLLSIIVTTTTIFINIVIIVVIVIIIVLITTAHIVIIQGKAFTTCLQYDWLKIRFISGQRTVRPSLKASETT